MLFKTTTRNIQVERSSPILSLSYIPPAPSEDRLAVLLSTITQGTEQVVEEQGVLAEVQMEVLVVVIMEHRRWLPEPHRGPLDAGMILDEMIDRVESDNNHHTEMNRYDEEDGLSTEHVARELQRMEGNRGMSGRRLKFVVKLVEMLINKLQMEKSVEAVREQLDPKEEHGERTYVPGHTVLIDVKVESGHVFMKIQHRSRQSVHRSASSIERSEYDRFSPNFGLNEFVSLALPGPMVAYVLISPLVDFRAVLVITVGCTQTRYDVEDDSKNQVSSKRIS